MTKKNQNSSLRIIDSHLHFYDAQVNKHEFLDKVDLGFEAFVGDYSTLPRRYLPEDYLKDCQNYVIAGVVWHEFLSEDPIREAAWAESLAGAYDLPMSLVALVDFLDPDLERKLEIYQTLPHVTAVREHMVWDSENPKKRFAVRPDLLKDPNWYKRLAYLNSYSFKCGLEVFAPQLADLTSVIKRYPNIGFTLALMGWPLDISAEGFARWKKDLKQLSECENVCVEISALECIFGMNWTESTAKPWIYTTLDLFGIDRCMLGSHSPILKLSRNFDALYESYEHLLQGFSDTEKNKLFNDVAKKWFRLEEMTP